MPFQTSITITGEAEITRALTRLTDAFRGDGLTQVLRVVAQRVQILLAIEYPPQTNAPLPLRYRWDDGKLHKFVNLRQQRKVMALAKEGKIPYRRKHTLMEGARFTITPIAGGVELNVTLQGNRGKFTFGKFQSFYFEKFTLWEREPFNLRKLEANGQVTAAIAYAIDSLFQELERA